MRPISGFERPIVQWLFVGLSVVLIVTAGAAAWGARRANAAATAARALEEGGRLERQHLDAQLARERSAREALSLELARQRETGAEAARMIPTLTLRPLATRGSLPPVATVATQHAAQVIEMRLVLPPGTERYARFDVVVRDWATGEAAWSRGGLVAGTIERQRMLSTFVTGDVFRAAAYELLVSGMTANGQRGEVASYEIAFR
jgi:hypothetical protein